MFCLSCSPFCAQLGNGKHKYGRTVACFFVSTKSTDPVMKFGLKAFHSSLLRHFEVQKVAASSSALQVSRGHSSVASRSHINRKNVLAALRILQKWPLCGKLKYKATQICYTCFLLAGKVTAQCTLVGQVCTSPLLNYRRAAKDMHLLLRTESGLKKKKKAPFTYCVSVPFR